MLKQARDQLSAFPQFFKPGAPGAIQGSNYQGTSTEVDLTYQPIPALGKTSSIGTSKPKADTSTGASDSKSTASSGTNGGASNSTINSINVPALQNVTLNVMPSETGGSSGSGFGLSDLDTMSRGTAVFYRFMNLYYLFSKSLVDGAGNQVLLGFDISIEPREQHDLAAEVSFTLQQPHTQPLGTNIIRDNPLNYFAVSQIFPQRETYNVVDFRQSITSVGLGAVLGPISLAGRTTNEKVAGYLLQDVDTVAFVRERHHTLTFGWQFRPVLDRPNVSPGVRRVYVLLQVPRNSDHRDGENYLPFLDDRFVLEATKSWVRIDRKTGATREIIK